MSFLRNVWYCSAWSSEITAIPLARTILNEKLVFYRTDSGVAVAIGGLCPHRFAPLSAGKVNGERIACPYHGIEFGPDGKCALNPHGPAVEALNVASYKVVEREGAVWIWMGDQSRADPALIPDLPHHDDPNYAVVRDYLNVKGHYELVTDNLLDLSHTQFLHPFLVRKRHDDYREVHSVTVQGDVILKQDDNMNAYPTGFVQIAWPDSPDRIDTCASVRWEAPANMMLHITFGESGQPPRLDTWGAELITPETDSTCHYFWSQARNFGVGDQELSKTIGNAIQAVFTNEDGWIISLIQDNLDDKTDILATDAVLLRIDEAAVRARRIIRAKMAAEADAPRK